MTAFRHRPYTAEIRLFSSTCIFGPTFGFEQVYKVKVLGIEYKVEILDFNKCIPESIEEFS